MYDNIKAAALFFIRMMMVMVVWFGIAVLFVEGESATVKIPVTCTGRDCTVILYDMEGRELDELFLKVGENSFFQVFCDGLKDHHYLVKLSDKDRNCRNYDRKEYHVTITTCRGENNEIRSFITADQMITEEKSDGGKVEELLFVNDVLPIATEEQDSGIKNPGMEQYYVSGEKSDLAGSSNTGSLPDTGVSKISLNSNRTDGKLPQTGSLWLWISPWLAIVGAVFIAAGFRLRHKHRQESVK